MGTPRLSRRLFLSAAGAAGLAAGGALAGAAPSQAAGTDPLPVDPFTLGVASGDALPGAVVLWTRLAPVPAEPGFGMDGRGAVEVRWELASDPALLESAPAAAGVVVAEPTHAWSVHVDAGGLKPGRYYYYRFRAGGWSSPVGRTRTTPVPSSPDPARFAVLSCQNLARPGGGVFHLNGVAHLATRDDVDFVVYLGDYIYDFGRPGHIPARPCLSLEDYRRRYGQYRSRASLQAMHARFPVYAVPDDHEFYDGVLGGDSEMTPGQGERFDSALQAYWENMPLRGGPPVRDATGRLGLRLHRRVRWGQALDLLLVDDRQHRTSSTTILGADQMDWLLDEVAGSHAAWTAIGSGVPLSWFPGFTGAPDKWTGYDADRSALTDALAARLEARQQRPFNPVVLSGDTHRGVVTHVRQRQDPHAALVATEFVGPPVTSNSSVDFAAGADEGAFRAQYAYEESGALQSYRGYLHCAVTSADWTACYVLGDEVERADGTVETLAQWWMAAGSPVGSVRAL